MKKYVLIRLIDGSEYYVLQNGSVIGFLDPKTGIKSEVPSDQLWIIHGFWYNKIVGKGHIALIDFITELAVGNIHFEGKKGFKYGIHETKNGKERNVEPLDEYGVSFVILRDI